MTRKEEILQAARDYVGSVTFSSSSDVIHFENGAKWADEHPVNMWHDMSEEPRKYEYILFEYISNKNELKYFTQYVTLYDGNLLKEFEKFGKCRWAYINDLLPKGGEKRWMC